MHRTEGLSPTHEMYLKVLYHASRENGVGRVRDLANGLGVSPGTVSAVLKKLERNGLIRHDLYGVVCLTDIGRDVAGCVVRRFETIRAVLTEVLGVDSESAEVDACMMEHGVSPITVNRMEKLVELVRAGGVDLSALAGAALHAEPGRCEVCEADGACQAEAMVAPRARAGADDEVPAPTALR